MTIAQGAIAEAAVAADMRAPKNNGTAPAKRKITAHGDAELIPEPR